MNFEVEQCTSYVKMLLCHDEVERALWVMDNLPGAYRERVPAPIQQLKAKVLSLISTPHDYMVSDADSQVTIDRSVWALDNMVRGLMIKKEVELFNSLGLIPHIVDMGPGEYFAPIGLQHYGLRFTYKDIGLNTKARALAHELLHAEHLIEPTKSQPVIYLALEVIEHLNNPKDIAIEMHKHCFKEPLAIHISTPCYTYDLKPTFEEIKDLPHLRTYTPPEFLLESHTLFPNYSLQLYNSLIMSVRALHPSHPKQDAFILEKN